MAAFLTGSPVPATPATVSSTTLSGRAITAPIRHHSRVSIARLTVGQLQQQRSDGWHRRVDGHRDHNNTRAVATPGGPNNDWLELLGRFQFAYRTGSRGPASLGMFSTSNQPTTVRSRRVWPDGLGRWAPMPMR